MVNYLRPGASNFTINGISKTTKFYSYKNTGPKGKRVSSLINSTADTISLSIKSGERCQKSGYWLSVAEENSRQYFKQGEAFPDFSSDWGEVYWQFDGEE